MSTAPWRPPPKSGTTEVDRSHHTSRLSGARRVRVKLRELHAVIDRARSSVPTAGPTSPRPASSCSTTRSTRKSRAARRSPGVTAGLTTCATRCSPGCWSSTRSARRRRPWPAPAAPRPGKPRDGRRQVPRRRRCSRHQKSCLRLPAPHHDLRATADLCPHPSASAPGALRSACRLLNQLVPARRASPGSRKRGVTAV